MIYYDMYKDWYINWFIIRCNNVKHCLITSVTFHNNHQESEAVNPAWIHKTKYVVFLPKIQSIDKNLCFFFLFPQRWRSLEVSNDRLFTTKPTKHALVWPLSVARNNTGDTGSELMVLFAPQDFSFLTLCHRVSFLCISERKKKKMKEQKKEKRGSQRDGKGEEGCVGWMEGGDAS